MSLNVFTLEDTLHLPPEPDQDGRPAGNWQDGKLPLAGTQHRDHSQDKRLFLLLVIRRGDAVPRGAGGGAPPGERRYRRG